MKHLYYGDNLDVLRKYIKDETVDLCYIDPPFNSKRNYNQIYNNLDQEDLAQAQAFIDTWKWDDLAVKGFQEIVGNDRGLFTLQTVNLILGFEKVLGQSSLLAYLISITLRVVEIHRVLKPTGSFYLHCDPTASHYLKLIVDSIFCPQCGEFQNEIIWCYSIGGKSKNRFGRKHDVILFYTKSKNGIHTFNIKAASIPRKPNSHMKVGIDEVGRQFQEKRDKKSGKVYRYYLDEGKIAEDYWTDIETLNREDRERLGYPTQKPRALMKRIIGVSTNEGDVVLDAYCGCGTTVAVAEEMNRKWIGIDITYQSVSLVLRELENGFGKQAVEAIQLTGIPRDIRSADALANKKDDRTRKEFEKWAVLTYSNNRAIINQKKGADQGIDGTAFFLKSKGGHGRIIFQVKSGKVGSKDIRDLFGTMNREKAELGIFITLKEPSSAMIKEAKKCGLYRHEVMGKDYPCIQIVTVQDILEKKERLNIPLSLEVLKTAERKGSSKQLDLLNDSGDEDTEAQATA